MKIRIRVQQWLVTKHVETHESNVGNVRDEALYRIEIQYSEGWLHSTSIRIDTSISSLRRYGPTEISPNLFLLSATQPNIYLSISVNSSLNMLIYFSLSIPVNF